MLALAVGGGAYLAADSGAQAPGQLLFEGRTELVARITGHDDALPAQAWRCANCHAGEQPLGGLLTRERLLTALPRRGGPLSRYDLPAFCRLLRTGVDPASILIDRTMPHFEIDDRQCEDLWRGLTRHRGLP